MIVFFMLKFIGRSAPFIVFVVISTQQTAFPARVAHQEIAC